MQNLTFLSTLGSLSSGPGHWLTRPLIDNLPFFIFTPPIYVT